MVIIKNLRSLLKYNDFRPAKRKLMNGGCRFWKIAIGYLFGNKRCEINE